MNHRIHGRSMPEAIPEADLQMQAHQHAEAKANEAAFKHAPEIERQIAIAVHKVLANDWRGVIPVGKFVHELSSAAHDLTRQMIYDRAYEQDYLHKHESLVEDARRAKAAARKAAKLKAAQEKQQAELAQQQAEAEQFEDLLRRAEALGYQVAVDHPRPMYVGKQHDTGPYTLMGRDNGEFALVHMVSLPELKFEIEHLEAVRGGTTEHYEAAIRDVLADDDNDDRLADQAEARAHGWRKVDRFTALAKRAADLGGYLKGDPCDFDDKDPR
jgi:hypothetical protein